MWTKLFTTLVLSYSHIHPLWESGISAEWMQRLCHFKRMLSHTLCTRKVPLWPFNLPPSTHMIEFIEWKNVSIFYGKHGVKTLSQRYITLLITSSFLSHFWIKNQNSHLLLPHATMLCWLLIIMEQSTPHTTLWASKSPGKHTCCGELWVSWVPSPRRPFRQRPNH